MKNNLYLKKTSLLVFVATIMFSAVIIYFFNSKNWFWITIPVYFYTLSFFGYPYLQKQLQKSSTTFVSKYLLISTFKMLLHLGIIFILLFLCNEKILIAVLFLFNYFVFSIYEVISWNTLHKKH